MYWPKGSASSGAEVLATFSSGGPALTRHGYGAGEAYYLATMADPAGRLAVAEHLVQRSGIAPVVAGLPDRVEACARGDLVTVINHNPHPVRGGRIRRRRRPLTLAPYGYWMSRR